MFNMEAKAKRLRAGEKTAFIDPAGYQAFVSAQQRSYETQLGREQQSRPSP
jgi:hypothetical protein